MNKIKDALWDDYYNKKELLDSLDPSSDEYEKISREVDNIRKELIDVGKAESEKEMKTSQMQEEARRETIRNRITIGTFIGSTALSVYGIAKTFKFDEFKTVTSTLGRTILNGIVPKKK